MTHVANAEDAVDDYGFSNVYFISCFLTGAIRSFVHWKGNLLLD